MSKAQTAPPELELQPPPHRLDGTWKGRLFAEDLRRYGNPALTWPGIGRKRSSREHAARLYAVLGWHVNAYAQCWPSVRRLAGLAGMDPKQARRSLAALERSGLLVRIERGGPAGRGRGRATTYWLPDFAAVLMRLGIHAAMPRALVVEPEPDLDVGALCEALGPGWEPYWQDPTNRLQNVTSGATVTIPQALAALANRPHKKTEPSRSSGQRIVPIKGRESSPESERLKKKTIRKRVADAKEAGIRPGASAGDGRRPAAEKDFSERKTPKSGPVYRLCKHGCGELTLARHGACYTTDCLRRRQRAGVQVGQGGRPTGGFSKE